MKVKEEIAEDEVAVEPLVQEVLQQSPADPVVAAGLDATETPTVDHASETRPPETSPVDATTPAETVPTEPEPEPEPEQAVDAAPAPGDAVKGEEDSPAAAADADADDAVAPMVPGDAAAKPDVAATPAADDAPKKIKRKETRKRVRRVGKSEPRKLAKIEPSDEASGTPRERDVVIDGMNGSVVVPQAEGAGQTRRVLSKHDEKWNNMLDRLLEFKVSCESVLCARA